MILSNYISDKFVLKTAEKKFWQYPDIKFMISDKMSDFDGVVKLPDSLIENGYFICFSRKKSSAYIYSGGKTGLLFGIYDLHTRLKLNNDIDEICEAQEPDFKERCVSGNPRSTDRKSVV